MAIPSSIPVKNAAPEIVFFDLETTFPSKPGQKIWVLEFGAIVVCPRKLMELESYCTLIRPRDLSVVGVKSGRVGGITRGAVARAPTFEEVADKIFSILDGRIWAGHNIQRFDNVHIREAFAEINRPAPVPAGVIDSLGVLSEKFGKRAGNMKMASLATYFGLGQQKHRSLEDVRMNLEVLKHCATVLFLESSLPPSVLNEQRYTDYNITTRSRALQQPNSNEIHHPTNNKWGMQIPTRGNSSVREEPNSNEIHPTNNKWGMQIMTRGKSSVREESSRKSPPSTSATHQRAVPYPRASLGKMTTRMTSLLCSANGQHLNNMLKHSKSFLR